MKKGKPDFYFILLTFILVGFGVVMVFSTSYYLGLSHPKINDPYYFFKKQLMFGLGGLLLFFIASNIRYHFYKKLVIPFLLSSIILLLLVHIPGLGVTLKGASRWINLGFISFQPSEFVKLTMILYTSYIMVKKQDVLGSFKSSIIAPLIVISLICTLLMIQPHFSATVIILATCLTIIFCGGVKLRHIIFLVGLSIPILIGVLFMGEYRVDRIDSLNPESDPSGKTYQSFQSLIAIASGELTGTGLGQSIQKYSYLPEAHNDFIFSIIAEELGFIGSALLILLFTIYIIRGVIIAVKGPDQFGILLGMGIMTLFAIETIANIGVATSLLPATGVSLPLISYGGSALLIKLAQLGIVLNISRYNKA